MNPEDRDRLSEEFDQAEEQRYAWLDRRERLADYGSVMPEQVSEEDDQ